MDDFDTYALDDRGEASLSMSDVISKHVMNFGKDFRGFDKEPPRIPMCRLVHMEVVRTLQKGSPSIEKLKDSFRSMGYNSKIGMLFYVQPADSSGKVQFCTPEICESWDAVWVAENDKFEAECAADPDFLVLQDKMFSVFDGNHRLYAWSIITQENPDDVKYHPRVECTIFKGETGSLIEIEAAMHTVNQLGQAVVEPSWILDADRINRILSHDLEYYKPLIDGSNFQKFQAIMQKTRKGSWYSKKMPQEGLLYILCENKIKAYSRQFKMDLDMAVAQGTPWSKEETVRRHGAMMKEATKDWAIKVSKITPLLSPELEDFMVTCAELFPLTEINKKEKKPDAVVCTMDRARLFTAVSALDPKLRNTLLVAHCRPELRKQFFHPQSVNDDPVKQWCHTWHTWNTVEGIAVGLLQAALLQVREIIPANRLEVWDCETFESLMELIVNDFKKFGDVVKGKFFNTMWVSKYPDKEDYTLKNQKRAKRYVFRFFMYMEIRKPDYFWAYPAAFHKWVMGSHDDITADVYSMYPAEGSLPPRKLSEWERIHCPWYLDTDRWDSPFDDTEKDAFHKLSKSQVPVKFLSEMKQGIEGDVDGSAAQLQTKCESTVVHVDRSRKPRAKAKADPAGPSVSTRSAKKRGRKSDAATEETRIDLTQEASEAHTGAESLPLTPLEKSNVAAPVDATSTKKKKKRFIDAGESASDNATGLGFQRDVGNFRNRVSRHCMVESNLNEFIDSAFTKGEKPEWVTDAEKWGKDLIKSGCRERGVVRGGKERPFGVNAGFIYLPTGLKTRLSDRKVPKWNIPDHTLPTSFFRAMDPFLSDDGFLAILYSDNHDQVSQVISACQQSGKFECINSHTVMMSSPMFKPKTDIQVFSLRLDIFCRNSYKGKVPKDPKFKSLSSIEDPSITNLMTLPDLKSDHCPELDFAGNARLPVGFMQSVIELFTLPMDIVMDWTVGAGSTFIAGDYSGRFVIGLESRKDFVDTASRVFLELMSSKEFVAVPPLSQITPKKKKDRLRSVLNFDSDDSDESEDFVQASLHEDGGEKGELRHLESIPDSEESSESEWSQRKRFQLRRKLARSQIDTPEKPFVLPSYAEASARKADKIKKLCWESKGLRLNRGADRKFVRNVYIDDFARSQFVDDEAESTDRTNSSKTDSSESEEED